MVVMMGYPWCSQFFVTFHMVVVAHMRGSNSSQSGFVFLVLKLGCDTDLLDFSPLTNKHTSLII